MHLTLSLQKDAISAKNLDIQKSGAPTEKKFALIVAKFTTTSRLTPTAPNVPTAIKVMLLIASILKSIHEILVT